MDRATRLCLMSPQIATFRPSILPRRIFSASEVARGKPAPDLFLHAAAQMGVAPHRCVVVEDSRFGVAGAKAAGMAVVGYAGGVTPAPHLSEADVVIQDMADLAGAVSQLLC